MLNDNTEDSKTYKTPNCLLKLMLLYIKNEVVFIHLMLLPLSKGFNEVSLAYLEYKVLHHSDATCFKIPSEHNADLYTFI